MSRRIKLAKALHDYNAEFKILPFRINMVPFISNVRFGSVFCNGSGTFLAKELGKIK